MLQAPEMLVFRTPDRDVHAHGLSMLNWGLRVADSLAAGVSDARATQHAHAVSCRGRT